MSTREYLQLIYGHPTIAREALEHGHKKLETSRPVPHQQHHADQIEDAHEHAGHVQKLKRKQGLVKGRDTYLQFIDGDPAIFGKALKHWH